MRYNIGDIIHYHLNISPESIPKEGFGVVIDMVGENYYLTVDHGHRLVVNQNEITEVVVPSFLNDLDLLTYKVHYQKSPKMHSLMNTIVSLIKDQSEPEEVLKLAFLASYSLLKNI